MVELSLHDYADSSLCAYMKIKQQYFIAQIFWVFFFFFSTLCILSYRIPVHFPLLWTGPMQKIQA